MGTQKHVVIIGGGFAGLNLAQSLKHEQVAITIVDQQNHHLFQPLLYQVATGGLAVPEIAEPIRSVFAKRDDIRSLMDVAESVDLEAQTVTLSTQTLHYDYLVFAVGMVNSYFGNDHWAKHTIGLKSLNEARRIRQSVLHAFEKAEASKSIDERRRLMTVVIVGAGPTGVEMAGALSELTKRAFKGNFRSINPEESRIILIEAADRVLSTFSEKSSASAKRALQRRNVDLRLGTSVRDIKEGMVEIDGEQLEAETIIWTAGVEANPVVHTLPTKKDRRGRIFVNPDTSIPEASNVFAIGDIVNLTDPKGVQVPGVSPAAIQMGKYVARLIERELDGKDNARKPFTYLDKGSMATIGRSAAVVEVGKIKFSGFPAWILWLGVHLVYLIGFRNRIAVLLQWMYAYIKYRPGARVFERPASIEASDIESPVPIEPELYESRN